jgi:hypothetical protein
MNFCPYCGVRVNSVPERVVPGDPEKEKAINDVNKLLNYFSQKTAQYNEYDRVTGVLYKLRSGRNKILKRLSIVSFIIGGILLLPSVFLFIKSFIQSNNTNMNIHTLGGLAGANMWLMLVVYSCVFLVAAVVLIIVDSFRKERFSQNLRLYVNRYYALSDELYLNYLAYKDCPIKAPFTNPGNIYVVQQTIMAGQADSIENAVAFLSARAANNRVEVYSNICAEFAQKTSFEFRRNEEASKLNAVFLPGNFFSTR